jgi:polysaccharide export outer membrane protein
MESQVTRGTQLSLGPALSRSLSVQQAIAAGGGVGPLGSDWRIEIRRRLPNGTVADQPASLDDEVQPNDTIVVNERLF